MKKHLILLLSFVAIQAIHAQIDYAVFQKDQIWLFVDNKMDASDEAYKIMKCTKDIMILRHLTERSKKLVLKRETRIKSECLPIFSQMRDTEIHEINQQPYCGVLPFNSRLCKKHTCE
jgi:hypothetical protein